MSAPLPAEGSRSAKSADDAGWFAALRQLFEDSPLPMQLLDPQGMPKRQNDAQAAFNLHHGARVGIGEFSALDDLRSAKHGHAAQFRSVLEHRIAEYRFEVRFATDDGEERYVYDRLLVPLGEPGARPTGVFSLILDVTDRVVAEEERQRLEERIQHAQKLDSLGVLAGGVAHDFNNLLFGVMGNAGLALHVLAGDSPARKYVENIETAARRAADIAQKMLSYAGKGTSEKEPVDLSALVEDSADLLRVSVARQVVLESKLARDLPSIDADPTQIRQVVINLITNASEAMGERAGRIRLSTGAVELTAAALDGHLHDDAVRPGHFVYVEVEDQGVGMDAHVQRRMFDPFFSTKFAGRGLGMAGLMGIVRGHHGALRVESEVGVGTTIRVLFPVGGKPLPSRASDQRSAPPSATAQRTVLVIDDDSLVRSTISQMLQRAGFEPLVAEDGEKGVRLFQENGDRVWAVIVDMTMPGLDGAATLERLTAIRPDVPAVVMSGYHATHQSETAGAHSQTVLLQKPFDVRQLVAALNRAARQEAGGA